jgi:Entner-Doudoroff aldolase
MGAAPFVRRCRPCGLSSTRSDETGSHHHAEADVPERRAVSGDLDDAVDEITRAPIPPTIISGRVVGIGRRLDPSTAIAIADALMEGGVRAFEVTLNSEGALDVISVLSERFKAAGMLIGAGTVTTVAEAEASWRAGAGFIVTPFCHLGVIRWAVDHGVPVFPGAFTPTEIMSAWRAGASAVKLFPASAVGPSFVREMRGPMPEIPLLPTGGITLENAAGFLAAGAVAVGVGGWLTGSGDTELIRKRCASLLASVRETPA